MTEQVLSIQVPEPLYTRLQKVAESIPVSLENLVVQTLDATIPTDKDALVGGHWGQQDAYQESVMIVFQRMSLPAQERMEVLMEKNTEGALTSDEHVDLTGLVAQYEQIMIANSEALWRLNQTTALPTVN